MLSLYFNVIRQNDAIRTNTSEFPDLHMIRKTHASSHRDSSCQTRFIDVNKYISTHKHLSSVVGCRFVDPCWSVGVIDVAGDIVVCVFAAGIVVCKVVDVCCVVIDAVKIIGNRN